MFDCFNREIVEGQLVSYPSQSGHAITMKVGRVIGFGKEKVKLEIYQYHWVETEMGWRIEPRKARTAIYPRNLTISSITPDEFEGLMVRRANEMLGE